MNDITQPLPGHEPSLHTVEMVCDRLAALGVQVGPDTARDLIRAVLAAEAPAGGRPAARGARHDAADDPGSRPGGDGRARDDVAGGASEPAGPAEIRVRRRRHRPRPLHPRRLAGRPGAFPSPAASSPTRRRHRRAVRATTRKASGARCSAVPGAAEMLLHRFYDHGLAQASYLLGCERQRAGGRGGPQPRRLGISGDGCRPPGPDRPRHRDAHPRGFREREPGAGRADRGEALPLERGRPRLVVRLRRRGAGAVLLRDGDRFEAGSIQVQALHTPGHTPEHLTFLVTDGATATEPIAALTGDFVFVGDVGRPDLLERAAQVAGTMEQSARHAVPEPAAVQDAARLSPALARPRRGQRLRPQSQRDSAEHSGLRAAVQLGVRLTDEDEFVRQVLAGQPEPPSYFGTMKQINRDGPRLLGGPPTAPLLRPEQLPALLESGAFVIDARPGADFAARHVPGTISIPLNASFTTWAGWLAPYDRDVYLIVRDAAGREVAEAVLDLSMIGLDRVAGVFGVEAVSAWEAAGRRTGCVHRVGIGEGADRVKAGATLLDVRGSGGVGRGPRSRRGAHSAGLSRGANRRAAGGRAGGGALRGRQPLGDRGQRAEAGRRGRGARSDGGLRGVAEGRATGEERGPRLTGLPCSAGSDRRKGPAVRALSLGAPEKGFTPHPAPFTDPPGRSVRPRAPPPGSPGTACMVRVAPASRWPGR